MEPKPQIGEPDEPEQPETFTFYDLVRLCESLARDAERLRSRRTMVPRSSPPPSVATILVRSHELWWQSQQQRKIHTIRTASTRKGPFRLAGGRADLRRQGAMEPGRNSTEAVIADSYQLASRISES